MRIPTRIFIAIMLTAVVMHAQDAVEGLNLPINDSTIDEFSRFDKIVFDLVTSEAGIYVDYVQSAINKLAVGLLVVVVSTATYEAITHTAFLNMDFIIKKWALPYAFSSYVLQHWITPIPGLGISFIGLFTNTAAELASYAHLTEMDLLTSKLLEMRDHIGPWSVVTGPINMVAWCAITTLMAIVKAALIFVVGTGFVGLGVGACIGPIFLFFYMIPPLRHKWHSWVEAMIKYSLYRVIGNLVIVVWCAFLVGFLDRTLHGQYSLPEIISNFINLAGLMVAFILSVFKVPSFVSDFNSGSSSGGHGMAGATFAAIRGLFL